MKYTSLLRTSLATMAIAASLDKTYSDKKVSVGTIGHTLIPDEKEKIDLQLQSAFTDTPITHTDSNVKAVQNKRIKDALVGIPKKEAKKIFSKLIKWDLSCITSVMMQKRIKSGLSDLAKAYATCDLPRAGAAVGIKVNDDPFARSNPTWNISYFSEIVYVFLTETLESFISESNPDGKNQLRVFTTNQLITQINFQKGTK